MPGPSAETIVIALFAGLLGACVGSFLNVVIHRLPLGQSLVSPPSHCPSCGHAIRWYDNVPILGWLFLGGRCRDCGEGISPRYAIVEALTALLAAALAVEGGFSLDTAAAFWFAASLLALTYIDLDHRLLPDRITLPGIVVGLAFAAFATATRGGGALGRSVAGVLLGGGMLWFVAWAYHAATGREGMGGGDIKLLAMIGAFLGWKGVLLTLLLASFVGSAVGTLLMIRDRSDSKLAIPFGPFLAIGALVTLFWGDRIVDWYMLASGLAGD
ncbi:MAG: prepilin peptidase [Alphaproteobacteria bacterium]